eukprot:scaffold55038_cov66-Phaeocystis_antarctica.AAC.2
MLCCSPRSGSNLLERSGLFSRNDEEYEVRVIVWEARAVATAAPKVRLPRRTSAHPALQCADTRVELCTLLHSPAPLALRVHHPAANAARPQHAGPMRRLGAQAGKHVSVRVQPRGKVPGNYQAQQTDEGPCNAKGDAEFNWRMLWPMSVLEKAPWLYIAVSNYGSNEMIGESLAPRDRDQLGGAMRAGREATHGPIPRHVGHVDGPREKGTRYVRTRDPMHGLRLYHRRGQYVPD